MRTDQQIVRTVFPLDAVSFHEGGPNFRRTVVSAGGACQLESAWASQVI